MKFLHWNVEKLNNHQVGKLGELLVQAAFLMYNFDIYTPVVDDRCTDLVVTKHKEDFQCPRKRIQIKTVRGLNYVFLPKEKCHLNDDFYIALVVFLENPEPELFLIPSNVWLNPRNSEEKRIFVSRDYEGKKSKPEWGINLSSQNLEYLRENFRFANIVSSM